VALRSFNEEKMRKLTLLTCLAFAATALASTANAKQHHHHHKHWAHSGLPPAAERLITVGTPDCHVQGRFLRIAHHCPPEAIVAAPR